MAERARASRTATGRAAEDVAAALVERAGMRIVERNARAGRFELDIVAMDGDVLVFIEVRRRKRMDAALLSVTPKKRAEVARAAAAWLAARRIAPRCRFDVVVVSGADARRIENAFEAPP